MLNPIEVKQNFDWEMTRRKMCIFMPHFHGKKYVEFTVKKISTIIPKDQWIIIIGDDGTDENFNDLTQYNAYYFSLNRRNKEYRNACFIRNYCIKRCQSELFFQKDCEVVVLGDFIKNCIASNKGWRAGNIRVLEQQITEKYFETQLDSILNKEPITRKINDPRGFIIKTSRQIQDSICEAQGALNISTYFHYAYCIKTSILKSINGYDESFTKYGFEDSDMFCRLFHINQILYPDYECTAIHLDHPKYSSCGNDSALMCQVFLSTNPANYIRNVNIDWGEGI